MASQLLYIPTFIANDKFKPSTINPRQFFYNGLKTITPGYYFGGWTDANGTTNSYTDYDQFPYVDHYSKGTGDNEPDSSSESLLFFNEGAVYGTIPDDTLYTKYWNTYVSMLYNPKTRFVRCSAVLPYSLFIQFELNDIVIYKGSHYHLRAINGYNLKTGECKLELLGPIIQDARDNISY
tara:strand:- start:7638 stop:8177 length:540 start_codon:yes stop_codon:yes gene_type:complete